jgi:hypothetical protein
MATTTTTIIPAGTPTTTTSMGLETHVRLEFLSFNKNPLDDVHGDNNSLGGCFLL